MFYVMMYHSHVNKANIPQGSKCYKKSLKFSQGLLLLVKTHLFC